MNVYWKDYAFRTTVLDVESGRIFRLTDPEGPSYVYVPNKQVDDIQVEALRRIEAPRRMCAQCGRSYPTQRLADVCATMQHSPATDDTVAPQPPMDTYTAAYQDGVATAPTHPTIPVRCRCGLVELSSDELGTKFAGPQ